MKNTYIFKHKICGLNRVIFQILYISLMSGLWKNLSLVPVSSVSLCIINTHWETSGKHCTFREWPWTSNIHDFENRFGLIDPLWYTLQTVDLGGRDATAVEHNLSACAVPVWAYTLVQHLSWPLHILFHPRASSTDVPNTSVQALNRSTREPFVVHPRRKRLADLPKASGSYQ